MWWSSRALSSWANRSLQQCHATACVQPLCPNWPLPSLQRIAAKRCTINAAVAYSSPRVVSLLHGHPNVGCSRSAQRLSPNPAGAYSCSIVVDNRQPVTIRRTTEQGYDPARFATTLQNKAIEHGHGPAAIGNGHHEGPLPMSQPTMGKARTCLLSTCPTHSLFS